MKSADQLNDLQLKNNCFWYLLVDMLNKQNKKVDETMEI